MNKSGLLVLTSPLQKLRLCLPSILDFAEQHVEETLYVHLSPGLHSKFPSHLPTQAPTAEARDFITSLYSHGASTCSRLDIRVLLSSLTSDPTSPPPQTFRKPYSVVITDSQSLEHESLLEYITKHFPGNGKTPVVKNFTGLVSNGVEEVCGEPGSFKTYGHVVLGGTFDRVHTGHKILLSRACLQATKSVTIGVTDGAMNAKKTLCELIQPVETRIKDLVELLGDLKPSLTYKVVPILDPFGPSIVDPDLECIVVSRETVKGGQAVNDKRKQKGLSTLDTDIIELVEDTCRAEEEEEKISSSSYRKRLLGTLRSPPRKSWSDRTLPYVIGLTGGIASGKSSVSKRLEKLGAGIVDCDKLGHKAYLKGSPTFHRLVEVFGRDIVGEDGEVNRRALGAKVFADRSQLGTLNDIVWPSIAQLAEAEIKAFSEQGVKVVVLDAAVLLEAGWESMTHEVWVSIITKPEAVQRIKDRNKMSEEQALQRIESQMSNEERVEQAQVVISTLWAPEVTQTQVEKAWKLLQERIQEANVPNHHI